MGNDDRRTVLRPTGTVCHVFIAIPLPGHKKCGCEVDPKQNGKKVGATRISSSDFVYIWAVEQR